MSEIKDILSKIETLSESINKLVTQLAQKEIHDQYTVERMKKIEDGLARLHLRIDNLEKIEASNESIKTIKVWFWRSAIGAIGLSFAGGLLAFIKTMGP